MNWRDEIPEDVQAAFDYLRKTDDEAGELAGAVKGAEHRMKVERSIKFLEFEGSIAARQAQAMASREYVNAVEDYANAVGDFEALRARRKRAELTIEVWRSVNANRRQG